MKGQMCLFDVAYGKQKKEDFVCGLGDQCDSTERCKGDCQHGTLQCFFNQGYMYIKSERRFLRDDAGRPIIRKNTDGEIVVGGYI